MRHISEIKQKIEKILVDDIKMNVEIRGREYVFAEGFSRIETYTETLVCACSGDCRLIIRGEGLALMNLSGEYISVEGRISSVEFI